MEPVERNPKASRPRYLPPKGIGYFMNILSKVNRWIERQNKRGDDIPRFTKVQVRRIALFLENHHLFNFNALRKGKGRPFAEGRVKGMTAEVKEVSARYGADTSNMGVLEAGTGPAPVMARIKPSWTDQVREFKRIIKEQNKKLPVSVLDELLL